MKYRFRIGGKSGIFDNHRDNTHITIGDVDSMVMLDYSELLALLSTTTPIVRALHGSRYLQVNLGRGTYAQVFNGEFSITDSFNSNVVILSKQEWFAFMDHLHVIAKSDPALLEVYRGLDEVDS